MNKTNAYSCVLDAFAEVSGVPAATLISEIGHSGLELDGAPRGFHTQELVECMLRRGMSVTPIELYPAASNELTGTIREVFFPATRADNCRRFARHLSGNRGVVLGRNAKGTPHAVAWLGSRAIDSSGLSLNFLIPEDGEDGDGAPTLRNTLPTFTPHTFLRLTHATAT